MTEFQKKGCVVVKSFIDKTTIATISQYMENKLLVNSWAERKADFNYHESPSQYMSYADPLTETILKSSTGSIEQITGLELYPTYSYSRIYLKGDELTPHVDRPSCEISITINVATVGKPWPIWMKAVDQDPMKIEIEPGDAVLYKGCEVTHWRDKMIDTDINVQFMMHYVDKNGPYASYKWDKRPGLGYPLNTRSN